MTRTEALARFFRQRPGQWVDGRALAPIAGAYAWRSRTADLRRPPYHMRIDNRQRRCRAADGSTFIISEYMFVAVRASALLDREAR